MLTRRSFMATTVGAGAALAAERQAAAQADRRMIVDAQVHLWKAETPDWKWVPGLKPQLPEPFTIERLVPMMDEAGVDRGGVGPPSRAGARHAPPPRDATSRARRRGVIPPASGSWAALRSKTPSRPTCCRDGRSSRECWACA